MRRGGVIVRSSIAGWGTVTVRSGDHIVARERVRIAAGRTTLRLARTPPRGEYGISFDVEGAAGAFSDRLTVVTLRRLNMSRARRAAEDSVADERDGDDSGYAYTEIGTCARRSAIRVDCVTSSAYVDTTEDLAALAGAGAARDSECTGRVAVSLAPDGIHTRRLEGCALPRRGERTQSLPANHKRRIAIAGPVTAPRDDMTPTPSAGREAPDGDTSAALRRLRAG
jgi:hypothetical protein